MNNFSNDIKLLNLLQSLSHNNLSKDEEDKIDCELSKILRDIDRINIRKSFSSKLKNLMAILIEHDNKDFEFEDSENQMDIAINLNLFNVEYAHNFYKLIPPFVDQNVEIPEKVKTLYAESRYCFVFRQYSASIVLSRAIIEVALKMKLKVTEEKNWKISELLNKVQELNYLDKETAWIANKVINKANNILHRSKNATPKESLNAINDTREVLEYLFG